MIVTLVSVSALMDMTELLVRDISVLRTVIIGR